MSDDLMDVDADVTVRRGATYRELAVQQFEILKEQSRYADCKILLKKDGKEKLTMECHANILCAFSPVIEEQLQNARKEDSKKVIEITDLEINVLKSIVNYMYTGYIKIVEKQMSDILQAAKSLGMTELYNKYVGAVKKQLSANNVIGWLKAATENSVSEVIHICKQLITTSLTDVVAAKEFMELNIEQLKAFLRHCDSTDISPDDKLHIVKSWLSIKENYEMCDEAWDLIECYLPNVSQSLSRRVMDEEVLRKCPKLESAIKAVLKKYDSRTAQQKKIASELSLVVIGGCGRVKCWKLERHLLFRGLRDLTTIPPNVQVPKSDSFYSVCLYYGIGFILTGGREHTSCAFYDVLAQKWRDLPNLRAVRSAHASVCVLDELFVIGGVDNNDQVINSVESLTVDVKNAKWQELTPPPRVFHYPKAVHFQNMIYVMGDKGPSLFCFNLKTRKWEERVPFPGKPEATFTLAVGDNDYLYAVGQGTAARYNIIRDSWVRITQPRQEQSEKIKWPAVVFHDDKLFLIGGCSAKVQEYDSKKDQWKRSAFTLPDRLTAPFAFSMTQNQ